VRVCPKCGHCDPFIWYHGHSGFFIDWCRWEDFQREYPHIQLVKGELKQLGEYVYRRRKNTGLYVERQCLRDNPTCFSQWKLKFEKHKAPNKDPSQTKLLEVTP